MTDTHIPKAKINVVGDVIPHADLQVAASLSGGYQHMFANVAKQIKDGDINIANLETPVAPTFPYQGISLRFNASPVLLNALKSVGFNVMLTANNHAVDQTDQGYCETVAEIAKAHMISLGGWKNDEFDAKSGNIINVKGIKIGLLNYTLLSNREPKDPRLVHYISDISKANQEIQKASAMLKKNGAEYVILMIHWGIQYHVFPKKDIYSLAQQLLSGNIDLIIGGHPHVIQPIEVYKKGDENKVVAYSLGNFISHQRGLAEYGLMAKITLIRNPAGKVVLASFAPKFFKVHLSVASFRSSRNAMSYTYFTFKLMGITYLQFLDYQCVNKQAFDCLSRV